MTTTDIDHIPSPNVIALVNGKPVTSSLDVAAHFKKLHKNVMRAIRDIVEASPERGLNFEPSDYTDPTGRTLPAFNLTRDGFMFLVMGFTGPEADRAKWFFLDRFNAMERQLLNMQETIAVECSRVAAEQCARIMADTLAAHRLPAQPEPRPIPWRKQTKPVNKPGCSTPGVYIDTHPDCPHIVLDMSGFQFRIVEADGWRWWALGDMAGSIGRMNVERGWSNMRMALGEAGATVEQGRFYKVRPLDDGTGRKTWRNGLTTAFLREDAMLSWLRVQNPHRLGHRLTEIESISKLGLPSK